MKTWSQASKDGVKVPKIGFMLPFGPLPHSLVSLRQLYRDVYKPGRYQDLWFVWKGKPCIMAYPDNLTNDPVDREIAQFFTFRPGQPDYVDGPKRNDQWGWLEMYPQHGYVPLANGGYEQVTVGVAQNANPVSKGHCSAFNLPNAYGRNFTVQKGFDPRVEGYLYGWNFQEQWDRAIGMDPELIFVTGWNEYIAGTVTSTVACDYDRTFGVEIIDKGSNAIEGLHYALRSNTITIKAGQRAANVEVRGLYDNIEPTDSLGFILKLVMPEQVNWNLYHDRTKVVMMKSCPYDVNDFTGWCVVTSLSAMRSRYIRTLRSSGLSAPRSTPPRRT